MLWLHILLHYYNRFAGYWRHVSTLCSVIRLKNFQYKSIFRNGLRTTLEENSIDVTLGGVDVSFDLDFIIAQAPTDTGIEMVDSKDKEALLNTIVYYSQSVVVPFLATAFFSLVLFLSYCCKSRCFIILSRIFLIIIIILFFFIAVESSLKKYFS